MDEQDVSQDEEGEEELDEDEMSRKSKEFSPLIELRDREPDSALHVQFTTSIS